MAVRAPTALSCASGDSTIGCSLHHPSTVAIGGLWGRGGRGGRAGRRGRRRVETTDARIAGMAAADSQSSRGLFSPEAHRQTTLISFHTSAMTIHNPFSSSAVLGERVPGIPGSRVSVISLLRAR